MNSKVNSTSKNLFKKFKSINILNSSNLKSKSQLKKKRGNSNIAAGSVSVNHISTKDNPANPLIKVVTSNDARIIEEMFFYSGN